MTQVFQKELGEVQDRLVDLSESVTEIMEKASMAFLNSDVKKADEAIALAEVSEQRALAIDELAIRILSRQSPVARDLRILVSALRISASLERMGSLAGHIATIARFRYPESAVPETLRKTFSEMGALDCALSRKLTQLLRNTDVDLARSIQAEDERVDELHRSVFDLVLSESWKENAIYTVDVTLASRYHERFADHVVDISAKVAYLTTGEWSELEA
ncbi:MAG: phosphate transport system regulatory protein PhoU [Microbacteriaceae bacterium]|nr:phosphate transport system regulatory protein PhoU [Microbacteriaceae bacterium]